MPDNLGVAPVDPTTDVGRVRLLLGDSDGKPLDPPVEGKASYNLLSDAEIEAYLAAGSGSALRGIGFYYMALAGEAAKESKSVKDFDLSVDLKSRAGDLRNMALMWFDRADEEDAGAFEDEFVVVPTGKHDPVYPPELTPRPIRRF